EPAAASVLAGDPTSPAICAAVVWRRAWVADAGGGIGLVKLRQGGGLRREQRGVKVSAAAYQ
ncbi:unnamed protein product, partial [Prorocentrum cordatum]